MPRKPGLNSEFVMFDVVYEDGTQRSNRKVPRALLGGIDGDKPAHGFLVEQDREIAEKSGRPMAKSRTSRARARRRRSRTTPSAGLFSVVPATRLRSRGELRPGLTPPKRGARRRKTGTHNPGLSDRSSPPGLSIPAFAGMTGNRGPPRFRQILSAQNTAQQRDIAAVGAEEDVEGIAGKRHRADRAFQHHIGRHARHNKPAARRAATLRTISKKTIATPPRRRRRERGAAAIRRRSGHSSQAR